MRDFKGMKRQRGRNRNTGGKPQQHNANRAYDSNGPEGIKVRGAAQSVFEKYQQLARDATTGGDRVLAENYLQHAEHYFRLIRAVSPTRPVSDIVGRDNYTSGMDIDFEAEHEDPPEGAASEPEAQNDGNDGDERPRFENRQNRDDRPQNNNQNNQGGQNRDRFDNNRGDYNNNNRQNRDRDRDQQGQGQGGQRDRWRDRDDRGNQQNQNNQGGQNQGGQNQGGQNQGGQNREDRPQGEYRQRDDRPRDQNQNRDDRPQRDDRAPREDAPVAAREERPREEREGRRSRYDRNRDRDDRGAEARDPLAVIEPQAAAPLAPEPAPESSPRLRGQDGAVSELPGFLSRGAPEPREEAAEAAPKPKRRRAPKTFEGGDAPKTSEDA